MRYWTHKNLLIRVPNICKSSSNSYTLCALLQLYRVDGWSLCSWLCLFYVCISVLIESVCLLLRLDATFLIPMHTGVTPKLYTGHSLCRNCCVLSSQGLTLQVANGSCCVTFIMFLRHHIVIVMRFSDIIWITIKNE